MPKQQEVRFSVCGGNNQVNRAVRGVVCGNENAKPKGKPTITNRYMERVRASAERSVVVRNVGNRDERR